MPSSDVENYQGSGTPTVIQEGYDTLIGIFNDAASSLANGSVVEVSFFNSTTAGVYPWCKQPATQATVVHLIGVVDNSKIGQGAAGIPAATWGLARIRGYCPAILGAAAITTEHTLTSTNTAWTATDTAGSTLATNTFGIAKSTGLTVSPYTATAYIFGYYVAMP
jgi:hypothetical protein